MKKIFLLFVSCLFLVSGCGSGQSASIDNPYEIKVGSETLSFYDDVDKFAENGFEVLDTDDAFRFTCETNNIDVYDGKVYYIRILEDNITTYKSISVGYDVSKITDSFPSAVITPDEDNPVYNVYFNSDNEEVGPQDDADGTLICYKATGSKINEIHITKNLKGFYL